MSSNLVDSVWSLMRDEELYSPEDLANWSLQPIDVVTRVLRFLERYGFAEQVVKREPLFRKLADAPDPSGSMTILQKMIVGGNLRDVETVT